MLPHARVAFWPWILSSALLAFVGADGCAASSTNDAATGSDAAAGFEAATDDGGGSGSIFPTGDASACRPGDVETYQPSAYHFAAAAWRGVCVIEGPTGNGQDRLFFDKCLAVGATPDGCAAFQSDAANADCAKCILTPDSTTSHDGYGPLINHGTFITTNVAGCIELTDPSALSCAKAVQALGGCELRACEANCPVHDPTSRAAYDTCASHVDHAGCQSYDMAAAACVNAEASAAPSCLLPSFSDFYYAVVPLFCGVPPRLDGGQGQGFQGFPSRFEAGAAPAVDASDDAIGEEAPAVLPADASADGFTEARVDAAIDAKTADAAVDARVDTVIDARPLDASPDAAKD